MANTRKSSVKSKPQDGVTGTEKRDLLSALSTASGLLTLRIPEVPRSPNGPSGLLRMHWAARRKYFGEWKTLIRVALGPNPLPEPKVTSNVTIVQHRKRLLDTDNLYSSAKPCLDALVHWEIITSDDPKHCDLVVTQCTSKEQYTTIYVSGNANPME